MHPGIRRAIVRVSTGRSKKAVSAASAPGRTQPGEQRLLHGIYWLLATAVFGADQLSKIVAQEILSEGSIEFLPILNFSLAYNRGAAFGIFSGGQMATLLLAISIVACIAFALLLHRENRALPCLSWSLLLGGALGNSLDRLLFNRVTDFIDFHLSGHHFPAFNIADASLTFGVLLMLLALYRQRDEKQTAKASPPPSSRRKGAPAESGTAVSELVSQADKEKQLIDPTRTSVEHAARRVPESRLPATEPVGPPPERQTAEAGEDRQATGALAPTTEPAPFAPLAEANLSRVFAAEPYSAGPQQQGNLRSGRREPE